MEPAAVPTSAMSAPTPMGEAGSGGKNNHKKCDRQSSHINLLDTVSANPLDTMIDCSRS
jgi:hypothetical protein